MRVLYAGLPSYYLHLLDLIFTLQRFFLASWSWHLDIMPNKFMAFLIPHLYASEGKICKRGVGYTLYVSCKGKKVSCWRCYGMVIGVLKRKTGGWALSTVSFYFDKNWTSVNECTLIGSLTRTGVNELKNIVILYILNWYSYFK